MASALWLSDDPTLWRAHLADADATTIARCTAAAAKSKADSVVADAHERYVALSGQFPQQSSVSLAELQVCVDLPTYIRGIVHPPLPNLFRTLGHNS